MLCYRDTVFLRYSNLQNALFVMVHVIAVANQKGGVAKTTTVIHLGAAIAEQGMKVLLVDLDPQGHLAEGFGIVSDKLKTEMSDVLEGSKKITEVIIQSIRPNLDLAPSNIRLSDMELTLVNLRFREYKLKRAIEPVLQLYDYVIVDCPPNLGLLTINALMAADRVLIPMATEYYSMLGVSLLIKTVQAIQREANPKLSILGIIHTRNKRTIHAHEVIARTKGEVGSMVHVFEIPVNESTRFAEATGLGKTVYDTNPELPGAKAYKHIAQEILTITAVPQSTHDK
jgi:chromosome partitioning protein